ncbi:MAG: DUF5131 family protein, partial [Alphaproteobacteria bacterium]
NWLSIEPQLSDINLLNVGTIEGLETNVLSTDKISWVVCGGESGGKARPSNPRWHYSLREQCKATGSAMWFKQSGEWVGGLYDSRKSKVMLEDGRIWWIHNKRQLSKLHFWDEKVGVFDVISVRVGMNSKPVGRILGGVEEMSDNHQLGGRIQRELPRPRRKDFVEGAAA